MTIQQFSEIKFEMAENLPASLKAISPKQNGLVVIKSSINSLPRYVVEEVKNPTIYLKNLGKEQGITQDILDKGFEGAFSEDEE